MGAGGFSTLPGASVNGAAIDRRVQRVRIDCEMLLLRSRAPKNGGSVCCWERVKGSSYQQCEENRYDR